MSTPASRPKRARSARSARWLGIRRDTVRAAIRLTPKSASSTTPRLPSTA